MPRRKTTKTATEKSELYRCVESYICLVKDEYGREVDAVVRKGDLIAADDGALRPEFVVPVDATTAAERQHGSPTG
jgi:hypothetical protein